MRRPSYNVITALLLVTSLAGAGMLLYPILADWWNSVHQSQAIADYDHVATKLSTSETDAVLAEAEAYNARLAQSGALWRMDEEQMQEYNGLLDVTGTGLMAYVDIPKIGVTLPIYHGTSEEVLVEAIGHIAGTSLPVGGAGTHCSVSGHRGLPNAQLLTDAGMLEAGDLFVVTVLDRVLTYEVDQVRIVLPTEIDDLAIDPDEDYMTLVTCTPYGVNSHRLLVRGHRVDNLPSARKVVAEAVQIHPYLIAIALAIPAVALFVVSVLLGTEHSLRHKELLREVRARFRW